MAELRPEFSVKGERSMAQGFIAQYAAEAAGHVEGVAGLDTGVIISLKEAIGGKHEGRGVKVFFPNRSAQKVRIEVYPIVYFSFILPDVAWQIQERVKKDVELYTGLIVEEVNVHIMGVSQSKPSEAVEERAKELLE
ncbi:MAG: Asp23/Gls24 family envelope stress response protein [Eubacteriales bacterium]|nr:Asp23/Gls24 family envelope stress response protein [Eubacteriales bacterium]